MVFIMAILSGMLWNLWYKFCAWIRPINKAHAEDYMLPLKDLIDKIVMFCEAYSGVKYFPYQEQFARRIIRSLLENDAEEITALFARQSGKSETVATTVGGCMIILPILSNKLFPNDPRLTMFKEGLWVGIFAPSERQAKTTYNRMRTRLNSKAAQAILADPDINLTFSVSNGQNVALSNGSRASAISASEGSNIEGESFMLIICEECQDISNYKIQKSIHPMGAFYSATMVKVGTATTFVGNFYECIQRNKARYETDKSVKNHFEYDWKTVAKYNARYAKYIEQEKKRLGENSDEFNMSYNLKWILVRGMFVSPSYFEKTNLDTNLGIVSYDKSSEKTYVAGLDQAKSFDGSVLTITEVDWNNPVMHEIQKMDDGTEEEFTAYATKTVAWYEYQGDYFSQYNAILDDLSHYNIVRLVADATREESQVDHLKATLNCEVVAFKFTPKDKSAVYKTLDREIKSGRAKVAGDALTQETTEFKRFQEQLYGLQKNYRGTNMVVENSSEKVHDDYPDSWALAIWGCCTPVEHIVASAEGANPMFKRERSIFYERRNQITSKRRR